eukprot:m.320947 g.320947  ORF g.320947 m.320947 type:complete len:654 (+) comp16524_c0_seq7:1541-3502(+)
MSSKKSKYKSKQKNLNRKGQELKPELKLKIGDVVLCTRWWSDKSEFIGTPHVAVITSPDGDMDKDKEFKLLYFYRPEQTNYQESQKFFPQEVMISSKCAIQPKDCILSKGAVLSPSEFEKYTVANRDIPEDNVFVCMCKYEQTGAHASTFSMIEGLNEHVLRPTLKKRTIPVKIERVSVGELLVKKRKYVGKMEIVTVPDSMVPKHIKKKGGKSGKRKRTEPPPQEDSNNDVCKVCDDGGELYCCDGCPSAFHKECANIPVEDNDDPWYCSSCQKKPAVMKKKRRPAVLDNDDDEDENDDADDGSDEELADEAEDYFLSKRKTSKHKTSSKTLSGSLRNLTIPQINKVLGEEADVFAKDKEKLQEKNFQKTKDWPLYLTAGFNILCYGFGSKKSLLMDFTKEHLCNKTHVVVNGYFPSLHIKQILSGVIEAILGYQTTSRNVGDQLGSIKQLLQENPEEELYLVIHNIDGAMLRNEVAQDTLAKLVAMERIHLLASIDHINAPLLWDHGKLALFNWYWVPMTTFESYNVEVSYEGTLIGQSGIISLKGTEIVMHHLTKNHKKAFWIILQHQKQHGSEADYKGLSFADLFSMCKERFVAHDDSRLRGFLKEFSDHKLIMDRKVDGVEMIYIPGDDSVVSSLISMMEENFGTMNV